MGHNVSKSKNAQLRYQAELNRYKLHEIQKLPTNIHRNKGRLSTQKKPALAVKYEGKGWVRSLSLEEEYEAQSFLPGATTRMKDPGTTTFAQQVSGQSSSRKYPNRTASLQRQKAINTTEHQFLDNKPYHPRPSFVYGYEAEPPQKQRLKSWNDHGNEYYSADTRNPRNAPNSYNSMTKSQHRFDEENSHKYKWDVPASNRYPVISPGAGLVGPRVLPSPPHVPGHLPPFPSSMPVENESQKPHLSYEDIDDFYHGVGDGIQVAGDVSNWSKQSLTMTSSETSPDILEKFNGSESNNNFSRMESEKPYHDRFYDDGDRRSSKKVFRPNRDDASTYSSNTMDKQSNTLKRYYSQQRLNRSRVISTSASEESDESEQNWKRKHDKRTITQSQTNFGRNSKNFYPTDSNRVSTETLERRSLQRPMRELNINRSPEVSREQQQSLGFRSTGHNDALWQNDDEQLQTNFGRNSKSSYPPDSNMLLTETQERRSMQRPPREPHLNRSPEVSRELQQSRNFRSAGPNDSLWQNNEEQSQTNFGRNSTNFYPTDSNKVSTGTLERRSMQRPPRESNLNRSPDFSRELQHLLGLRSTDPNDALGENNEEAAKRRNFFQEQQAATYKPISNELPQPSTGTLTRRSLRSNPAASREILKNFSPDEIFYPDKQDSENAGETNYQQSTMTIQRPGRRSKNGKTNMTRSVVDFEDQAMKHNTLPDKLESMFQDITREEKMNSQNQSANRRKKRSRKKGSESRDSPPASTQELEKIIESQLAAALTSVMTQRK